MPEAIIQELWGIVPTVIYFILGLLLFGFGVYVMEKVTPFSIKKRLPKIIIPRLASSLARGSSDSRLSCQRP